MKILSLSRADASAICELDKRSFGAHYDLPPITFSEIERILLHGFIFGIRSGNHLASNIQILKKSSSHWYIWGIASHPNDQGKGHASHLLSHVIQLAKKQHAKKISTTVRLDNTASLQLFSGYGFHVMRFSADHFGNGKHRLILEKEI